MDAPRPPPRLLRPFSIESLIAPERSPAPHCPLPYPLPLLAYGSWLLPPPALSPDSEASLSPGVAPHDLSARPPPAVRLIAAGYAAPSPATRPRPLRPSRKSRGRRGGVVVWVAPLRPRRASAANRREPPGVAGAANTNTRGVISAERQPARQVATRLKGRRSATGSQSIVSRRVAIANVVKPETLRKWCLTTSDYELESSTLKTV
ncbi:protein PRRC2A-like [Bacillus rossius redtenbacheri]|uniref:protein PRRC2A-like n=1 Tax=Bacillus rossius redtenbacheri TaxID=93214 RepID=UPI002FDE3BC3